MARGLRSYWNVNGHRDGNGNGNGNEDDEKRVKLVGRNLDAIKRVEKAEELRAKEGYWIRSIGNDG